MRAMAHPIRLDLLEALATEGPLTATQAAELIGETPTTCSFHLRQLQKYGFVEDSAPRGTRERPWRLTDVGNRISDDTGDAETDLAARALSKVLLDRYIGRIRRWWDERSAYPPRWKEATGFQELVWIVTEEELEQLMRDLEPILWRFKDRLDDASARPAGSAAVQALFCSYLMRLPKDA
jgi:predicted ArsR family transcriptional regulator